MYIAVSERENESAHHISTGISLYWLGIVSIVSGSCLLSSEKGGETRRHEKFQWNGTIVKVLTVRKIYRQYLDLKEY